MVVAPRWIWLLGAGLLLALAAGSASASDGEVCTADSKVPLSNNTAPPDGALEVGTLQWLVTFRSPLEIWHDEPTFLLCELELYMLAILSYMHAWRHGGRYHWLWWTTVLHGFTVELVSYWYEDIDNFWHAQSTLMWFGMREPLHIICLYPGYVYPAAVVVSRLNIMENMEPFAVGLLEALIDVPYDVMGIRLLWWSWHDTDSNIYDRSYAVPWCSYFFHASFGCAFTFLRQRAQRYFTGVSGLYSDDDVEAMPWRQQQLARNWWGELKAALAVGALSFPLGVMAFFVPLYHVPHDLLGVHSEVCVMLLVFIYGTATLWGVLRAAPRDMVEHGEREMRREVKRSGPGAWHVDEAFLAMLLHFGFYIGLVLCADPAAVRATGLHQELAPLGCHSALVLNESVGLLGLPDTPLDITRHKYIDPSSDTVTKVTLRYGFYESVPLVGQRVVIERNETICPLNFSEPTQEFWCSAEQRCRRGPRDEACSLPAAGVDWYTLCGTSYVDPESGRNLFPEYALLVIGVSIVALCIFASTLAYPRTLLELLRDGRLPRYWKTAGAPAQPVVRILERQVDSSTGVERFLVERKGASEPQWAPRAELVCDGAGPAFGERGGLYGVHGVHGETSTRERLREFNNYNHAVERIKLWKKTTAQEKKRD